MVEYFLLFCFVQFCIYLFHTWGKLRRDRKGVNRSNEVPFGFKGMSGIGFLPHFKGPQCQSKLIGMKRKYGKICKVRLGSYDCVWLNDYELIKTAWSNDALCARPELPGISQRTKGMKGGLIFNDGKDFVEQRKFVLQQLKTFGLGKTAISNEIINTEIHQVIETIEERLDSPISTTYLFNIATFNILWSIINGSNGSRFDYDNPEMCQLVEILNRHMELNDGARAAFFMPWLTKYFPWFTGWSNYISDANLIFEFWNKFAEETMKNFEADSQDSSAKDTLLKAYCEKIAGCTEPSSSFYKDKGVASLAIVLQDLFIAGSETTASTLQWLLLYLATFQNFQEKVAHEIFYVLGPTTKATTEDSKRLPFTECFILETLRYSTLAPLGMLHSSSRDVTFHGFFIPKDTILISNVCAVHYDEEYWEEPMTFNPERFLPIINSGKGSQSLAEAKIPGFIPFSSGRRFCPGSKLAQQTLFLALISIIQRFEISVHSHSIKEESAQLKPKIGISAVPHSHKLNFQKRVLVNNVTN